MGNFCDVQARKDFEVVLKTQRSEAATMALEPGESTGGPNNNHPKSDQWLYVIKGSGKVIIDEEEVELRPRRIVLIKAGQMHEVKNEGEEVLETVNIYAPPAY